MNKITPFKCNSLDELIAVQVSNARRSLAERHYFVASACCSPGNEVITTFVSYSDGFSLLNLDKLPSEMTLEQAIDKYAQALSSVDRRTVINKKAPFDVKVEFSKDEFKRMCFQYYLPVSVEKIHSILRKQMAESIKNSIPYCITARGKFLEFSWQPDFVIHYTTRSKIGLFANMKDPLKGEAVCFVINDYFGGKYEFTDSTALTLKDEFNPLNIIRP